MRHRAHVHVRLDTRRRAARDLRPVRAGALQGVHPRLRRVTGANGTIDCLGPAGPNEPVVPPGADCFRVIFAAAGRH